MYEMYEFNQNVRADPGCSLVSYIEVTDQKSVKGDCRVSTRTGP